MRTLGREPQLSCTPTLSDQTSQATDTNTTLHSPREISQRQHSPTTTQRGAIEDIRDMWREATGYGNYSPLKLGREALEGSAFTHLLRSDAVAR